MNTTTYLASKPRYEILDGLRGVAAMIVVAYHLFETYSAGPVHQILNHGYLAVDFFFVLSGFVIGYAYDYIPGNILSLQSVRLQILKISLVFFVPAEGIARIISSASYFFAAS